MANSSKIVISDLRTLQFLIINAQCYIQGKKELTQMDKDVSKLAGDLIVEIRGIRRDKP